MAKELERFPDSERKHPATAAHPHVCPYCDSAWAAGEFLDEHIFMDHELQDET